MLYNCAALFVLVSAVLHPQSAMSHKGSKELTYWNPWINSLDVSTVADNTRKSFRSTRCRVLFDSRCDHAWVSYLSPIFLVITACHTLIFSMCRGCWKQGTLWILLRLFDVATVWGRCALLWMIWQRMIRQPSSSAANTLLCVFST